MVRRRGSTWSANRPMTSPDASTDITLVQESQSSSSSLSHIMKRTYSQVFSSTPLDLAFSDDIATIKGKERATSMQKDRRPSNTPPVLPKEASSFRGLVRRASMSVKRQLHPPSKLLKESPARDSSQSIASSSSPLTTLPERRRPSLSQQFKSGLRSLRRHAVSNQSGEEGRWNPSSLPLPQGPPVNSVYPMYPGVPEYRQGQAARASAAAHNTRLQYGVPANSPMHSPFEGSECDSIMGNADSIRTLAMTRQDSVDSLDAANQGSSSPIVRIDPVRTLPTELMWEVLGQLDCATLAGAERVSKSWNRIVKDQAVWQKYYQRRYTAKTYVEPAPIQMGGTGVPTAFPGQDWKKAAFARRTIERRWATGRPAAIYFNGHTDSVYCCQFDEEKIITGSRDRTIRIWDINTGRCLKVIGGPSYIPVASNSPPLPVESSNTVLNVASVNGTPEGREIYHVPEDFHSASILCLQYDEEIMVTGSSDNTCIVWSMKDFQPKFRLRRHSAGVLDVCLDDKHIISCSKDQKICVWDRRTGALIKELTGHTGPVNAVQLRGHLLVSASGDGIAKLWDLNSMTCIRDFSSKDRGLAAVEFSDDTKYVLAGGNDQVVYKFDTENGELVHTYQGHTGLVRSLFLDAFNDVVISGSYDQSLRIYNYTTGKLYGTFENWTTSWILSAKSDYRRCVCTSQDGRALMLDFGYKVKGAEILKSMS